MSFIDLDKLTPHDLIANYVLDCAGRGHFLPYADYAIVAEWLEASPDPDTLLLVLADILPTYFGGGSGHGGPRSLAGAKRRVLQRLQDRAMRQLDVQEAPAKTAN